MVIKGIHLLQTYICNFECDHCFVYSGPFVKGVMTISDMNQILDEAKKLGYVERIYFEGGEPFLYYQSMLWGLRQAKKLGFKTGIVTNCYWATSIEDAIEWLTPIAEIGIDDLSISDDAYHFENPEENLARYAYQAAKELNVPTGKITIEDPRVYMKEIEWKGRPVIEGRVLFKGRAVEKLVKDLPRTPWYKFDKCLDEDFLNQNRVHIDPFGFAHVCQGITIGNMKQKPLSEIFGSYDPVKHPICGPILEGGPVELVKKYDVEHEEGYVDECHLCYCARLKLRDRFSELLAPDQMYGIVSRP